MEKTGLRVIPAGGIVNNATLEFVLTVLILLIENLKLKQLYFLIKPFEKLLTYHNFKVES